MTNEHSTVDQLLNHLQALIRDSEALLQATAAYAGDKVQETRSRAEETLAAAKERLEDVEAALLGKAHDLVGTGQAYVRENPWQAIGLAAAIGFLVGALVVRRQPADPDRE